MAMKAKKSRRNLRRRNWKRKGQAITNVNKALAPIPARFITKMKYSESFALSSISPSQVMNLNSIWDPNRTGVGHQPYGFDQLATLYNRYRVIACSYVINAYSGTDPLRIAVIPTNDLSITFGSVSQMIESPRARFKVQFPQAGPSYVKGKTYIPALVGRTKAQYMADDRYQSDVTSSPGELALLNILVQSLTDANVTSNLTVTLEYTVEFFDVKQLTQS